MSILDDFKLLERNGFKLLPYCFATNEDDAVLFANKLRYPVALKVVSNAISHKTDVGGVIINIKGDQALRIAYREIMDATCSFPVMGVLVQKMARKGIELFVGGKKDPQFGDMVILGLGGIYVEVFKDITARICPVNEQDVMDMVYELKSHPILMGMRGNKAINIQSLKDLIIRTCRFMRKEGVKEIDLNPVVFDSNGFDIIDARVIR